MLVMRRDYVEFVFLIVVSLVFFAPARGLETTVILTSPAAFQVFQRTGDSGAIIIRGHVENGGQYTVSALWGNHSSGVLYQGFANDFTALWESLPVGQHDLIITAAGIEQTIPNVGIGDVYIIAGQSNAVGAGLHDQLYMNTLSLRAGMFTPFGWQELQDPVGVTADFRADGSQWPILASYILATNTPVAFVPTALSGTSIISWQTGKIMDVRLRRVVDKLPIPQARAVLWQQGERDIYMRAKDYSRYLSIMAGALYEDYHTPVFAALIYNNPNVNQGIEIAIHGGAPVFYGADLRELKPDDGGVHYKSDEYLQAEAWLWWEALVSAGYYVIPQ